MRGQRQFTRHEDTRSEPERARSRSDSRAEVPYHNGLFDHLRATRKAIADAGDLPPYVIFADRTLRQMAAHMPTEPPQLARLHGIGTHKLETYGTAFIEAIQQYLNTHPDTEDARVPIGPLPASPPSSPPVKHQGGGTYSVTLELLREGKSLEEIARIRDLVIGTIEGHLARLIEQGEDLDWRSHIPSDTETLLRTLFEQHGTEPLAPIIEAADGAATYGQAKILRAAIELESR